MDKSPFFRSKTPEDLSDTDFPVEGEVLEDYVINNRRRKIDKVETEKTSVLDKPKVFKDIRQNLRERKSTSVEKTDIYHHPFTTKTEVPLTDEELKV